MRVEHKYLVPESLRGALRQAIRPFVRSDQHGVPMGGGAAAFVGYTVRSIYYDTSGFTHYYANEDGLALRSKPRIRGYNTRQTDSVAFLEVKRRDGAVGTKSRSALRFSSIAPLLDGGAIAAYVFPSADTPDAPANARRFLYRLTRHAMHPVILVTYDREAYIGTVESSLRITFDTRIRSSAFPRLDSLYSEHDMRPSLAGHFILEVKYDAHLGFPVWLRPFLSGHGLVRRALSKYYLCLTDQRIVQSTTKVRALARQESFF